MENDAASRPSRELFTSYKHDGTVGFSDHFEKIQTIDLITANEERLWLYGIGQLVHGDRVGGYLPIYPHPMGNRN